MSSDVSMFLTALYSLMSNSISSKRLRIGNFSVEFSFFWFIKKGNAV